MTIRRFLLLILGPPLLVAGAYVLSHSAPAHRQPTAASARDRVESQYRQLLAGDRDFIAAACSDESAALLKRLPPSCAAIVRAPFVIVGDLSEDKLERLYREQILPATEALWRSYFDWRPDQPVLIVVLSNEEVFRTAARRLDGYEPTAYAGYTQREERRIVVNAATGAGTLTHELSHMLAYFDFPELPEWFDEGLAALHESAAASADGLTLVGTPNWRCRLLREAQQAGELPALTTVIRNSSFRGEGEGLNYALVRGFCLYLQERGLLGNFYRKFRANVGNDPSGLDTLCELLGVAADSEIDRDFEAWIAR